MFPYAAAALAWLVTLRPDRARLGEAIAVALAVAALLFGWPALVRAGTGLRDRHRWAVCVCHAAETTTLCNWRATDRADGAVSPVRGVWNGVGLRLPIGSPAAVGAATEVDLPPGRYRITARADRLPPAAALLRLDAGGKPVATTEWTAAEAADTVRDLKGVVDHDGGRLRLELRAEAAPADAILASTVWLSDIRIEPDPR
jgi:hypothetical protein